MLGLLTVTAFAQETAETAAPDYFSNVLTAAVHGGVDTNLLSFSNSISLWIAIAIGAVATFMVFRIANRIGGGVLRVVYNYFAVGMLLITGASIIIVLPAWAPSFVVSRTHDMILILGFGIMVYGAKKLLTEAGLE